MALRIKMRNAEAFDEAVRREYIRVHEDGHLEWMLGSKTLLAYFLGRLFAGDMAKYSRRKHAMTWQWGDGAFPAKMLNALFGTTTLKNLRQNRENFEPPRDFQVIDNLFDMMEEATWGKL